MSLQGFYGNGRAMTNAALCNFAPARSSPSPFPTSPATTEWQLADRGVASCISAKTSSSVRPLQVDRDGKGTADFEVKIVGGKIEAGDLIL